MRLTKKNSVQPGLRRLYYAFVEGSAEPGPEESAFSRLSMTLDCVDANAFEEGRGQADENLLILRVLSTENRLKNLFNLLRVPQEGDWLLIELAREPGSPLVWALSAVDDYSGTPDRDHLVGLWFLDSEGIDTPSGPGPTRSGDPQISKLLSRVTQQSMVNFYGRREAKCIDDTVEFKLLFAELKASGSLFPRVLDVGQASCTALYTKQDTSADVVGFFDVGAPIWFHDKTFPKPFSLKLPESDGFVILSHWDFDHYSMAWWRYPKLRQLNWYAPNQAVGANGDRFQRKLGARLHFMGGSMLESHSIKLYKGTGAAHGLADDRNATGYVLRLNTNNEARLLTGDVAYDYVPPAAISNLTGITVPHHGGAGTSPPPSPCKPALAVASYGNPNRYRHPDETYLSAHSQAGWVIGRTAAHGHSIRQSHWL